MFQVFYQRPNILLEAQKAKFKPHFILQVLIFILLFFITSFAQGIPLAIYGLVWVIIKSIKGEISLADGGELEISISEIGAGLVLSTLFTFGVITLLTIVYCRFIEKRSLYSMGFVRENAFIDYLKGLLHGFIMFASAVLIAFIFGTIKFNGFVLGNGLLLLLGFFFGFVIQGMAEEVLVRGYFMVSVANRNSILLAVLSNSVIFSMLHIVNNGITMLAILNLILFGIFASLYMLKKNSIWRVSAVHTMWNFAQGNIFGIRVSGINTQVSVFSFELTQKGEFINGGLFGLEGGLAVTAVLLISIVVIMKSKGRVIEENNTDFLSKQRQLSDSKE